MAGTFFADSNRSRLRYLAETVWASTPTTGSPREMRLRTSKVSLKKDTKTSDEIRADRMIPSIIEVAAGSEGEVDFEFSAGAIDEFLAAFVYGSWSRPMTMDFWQGNVAVASTSTITINASKDYSGYLVTGRRIKLEGFKTPANNGYHQITSVAFSGGVTTITVTDTTLVVEAANPFAKLMDANDVLVLNSTVIRFGTAGASTIDSNGGNLFSSAIAAGQIKSGQKIWVDGLGYDVGSFTFTGAAAVGDTVTVSDSIKVLTFEAGTVPTVAGNVMFLSGADETATGANLAAAINNEYIKGTINVMAVAAAGVVTVTNYEATGGALSRVEAGALNTVVNFAGGDNTVRGQFVIVAAANDVLTVTPKPNTNANASSKKVTIKGSMLRNPSAAADFSPQSFTIETSYEDVGQHFINKGLRVSTFALDVVSKDICTGKINFKGEAMNRRLDRTSLFANAPFTAKDATPGQIMSATTNVGNLSKNGVPLATALKSISISGDANLREQDAVGHKFPVGIGAGRFKLTGKFQAYFQTGEMFDHFVAHDTVSLSWFFKDLDGQRYDITLPAIKFTTDPLSPGSIDQDVMEDIDWEAQRDPATQSMIQFDRFSSVKSPTNS